MRIAIASDHGGLELKAEILTFLKTNGYDVDDFGTHTKDSVDYPDYAKKAALAVQSGTCDLGILICGTGQGIGMAANKVKGIRCGIVSDCFSAEMIRAHNNANMIAIGARVLGVELALRIVATFLKAEFEGGRHQTRVEKINTIEIENNR